MDKKYQLVEINKVFEFQLNTIYSLVRIKDILMKGLEMSVGFNVDNYNPYR